MGVVRATTLRDSREEPLPQVPVILLCAEDDDLELVSFVHEARQHGLEPEVVPGVERSDKPLIEALTENDAALFVVLRSDNLTAERTLALKRAFNQKQKPEQHLLALRLEPERARMAVKTISRRLRQLMAPKPSSPARGSDCSPEGHTTKEPNEWGKTILVNKTKTIEPPGATKTAAVPPRVSPPTSEPNETLDEYTWTGTLIADDLDAAPLGDEEATPLPDASRMPVAPTAAHRTLPPNTSWAGTIIADPGDAGALLSSEVETEGALASVSPTPKRRVRVVLLAVVGVVAAAGVAILLGKGEGANDPFEAATISSEALRKDPPPAPPAEPAPQQTPEPESELPDDTAPSESPEPPATARPSQRAASARRARKRVHAPANEEASAVQEDSVPLAEPPASVLPATEE